MHGLECVGFFALPFILLSFHFLYFNVYFYFTLLTLFSIFFLVNADQFAETPPDKVGVKPEISYTWNSAKHSGRLVQVKSTTTMLH